MNHKKKFQYAIGSVEKKYHIEKKRNNKGFMPILTFDRNRLI